MSVQHEYIKKKLNLLDNINPLETFLETPTLFHLAKIGKNLQTPEIIKVAIDNYDGNGCLLEYLSLKHLTYSDCLRICGLNGVNLQFVSKRYIDKRLCSISVQSSGESLTYVPDQFRTYELCHMAINNDHSYIDYRYDPNGFLQSIHTPTALSAVPKAILNTSKGRELCYIAVSVNYHAFSDVPKKYKSKKLKQLADEHHCLASKNMQFTKTMCYEAIDKKPFNVNYLPSPWNSDKDLINYAYLRSHPEKLYASTIEKKTQSISFPYDDKIDLSTTALSIPTNSNKVIISTTPTRKLVVRKIDKKAILPIPCYYISDLHLEFQLPQEVKGDLQEIKKFIKNKIQSLIKPLRKQQYGIILVAGDVAHSLPLTMFFYETLSHYCPFPIISVLGNHELWNNDPNGQKSGIPLDIIINDYKKHFALICAEYPRKKFTKDKELFPAFKQMPLSAMLENDLYLIYKNGSSKIINEQTLLNADLSELTEVCQESILLILGGTGFSGLNPVYNATSGLYRDAVNPKEDILRSARFNAIYKKLRKCAAKRHLIVLTHMPFQDWTSDALEPTWIYINGHTHQNGFIKERNNAIVLFDNQIGYERKTSWHFRCFEIDGTYNPFSNWKDGIYKITPYQYLNFNFGRGIFMENRDSFRYKGDIYLLKRNNSYLFFLKNTGLSLLEGKRLHKATHDLTWYYQNMDLYVNNIIAACQPYNNALEMISKEVQSFGGKGTIHGCIVDIDFFNHIYLNPFDGLITPYCALNIVHKVIYKTMEDLLNDSETGLSASMNKKFQRLAQRGKLPILSKPHLIDKKNKDISVPTLVLETDIYKASDFMKSIQYVFDKGVIRIWRDEILTLTPSKGTPKFLENDSSR